MCNAASRAKPVPLLTVEGVSHTYANKVEALHDVTLAVYRGERLAVIGPSGCGKSTLLRIVAGLMRPSRGSVWLEGQLVSAPSPRISLMFQDAALLPWRTVLQNVSLPLELQAFRDLQPAADPRELLYQLGLGGFEDAYPYELSGGMAQRVALARALITQPPLLLLDEPFGALDALTRESLTGLLESALCKAETALIIVTHDINEAVFLSDRVLVSTPRPGHLAAEVTVDLPHPRDWQMSSHGVFAPYVAQIRDQLRELTLRRLSTRVEA